MISFLCGMAVGALLMLATLALVATRGFKWLVSGK